MRDVAERAGVSPTTVSFVLNGRMDFSIPQTTRDRVMRAAAELGYRRNGVARSLVRGTTQTIGVLVPGLDGPFMGDIAQGVQEVCTQREYHVLLAHTRHDPETEAQQVQLLLEHRVDGILCVASALTIEKTAASLADAINERVPCALINDSVPGLPADSIRVDDLGGARAAVEHLIGLGHRRIGHLSGGTRGGPAKDRTEGYRAALAAAGLSVDEALITGESARPDGGYPAMEALLDLSEPPTAVFATNDYLAAEAMQVARRRGLRVPEDIAVAGFGDLDVARYLDMTTVHRDAQAMGSRAAERVLARVDKPELAPQAIILPTHLVVRASSGTGPGKPRA
jgi:LacI family transcriptional regulator